VAHTPRRHPHRNRAERTEPTAGQVGQYTCPARAPPDVTGGSRPPALRASCVPPAGRGYLDASLRGSAGAGQRVRRARAGRRGSPERGGSRVGTGATADPGHQPEAYPRHQPTQPANDPDRSLRPPLVGRPVPTLRRRRTDPLVVCRRLSPLNRTSHPRKCPAAPGHRIAQGSHR
jgi:hypothetical protein